MSVVSTPLGSTLVAVYQTGLTTGGSPITRQKSLSDIRASAAEQAVYDTAQTLFSLTQHTIVDVIYRKNFQLTDE